MVHFGMLAALAKREMSDHLEKYGGNKILVWDEEIMAPLDLVVDNAFLKDHQVAKMFTLKPGRLPAFDYAEVDSVVFVTRPEVSNMDRISDNVKGEEIRESRSGGQGLDFHILFVPSATFLCETRLKDRGVFGSFTYLDDLSIWWLPLDVDLISMERRSTFRDYFLDQDPTCLHDVAKAMIALQAVHGFIPQVYGKGRAAKQLFDYMVRLRKEMANEESSLANSSHFDTLVILDRQVDLVSPLMTQLTYEGLIDESFGITCNKVKLPAKAFGGRTKDDEIPSTPGMDVKQVMLNSKEQLYAEIRDKNFNAVGPILNKKIKATEAQEEERHRANTVKELRMFVDKMPLIEVAKQSLSKHISIATLVKEITDSDEFLDFLRVEQDLVNCQDVHRQLEFVEDACCQELDLVKVLRVICLQSIVGFGLKPKVVDAYRRLILRSYGHSHLLSLLNLEAAGLLTKQQSGGGNAASYAVLRKRLNLTRSDDDEQNPTDISYVHCVYAPMSVRLVQNCAHSNGWKSIRDVLDMLPGPTFEEVQKGQRQRDQGLSKKKEERKGLLKRTLVLFVGGCTFAEVAALRFLSQQEDATTEYAVATTAVLNGNNFLEGLMDRLDDPLAFEVRR